MLNRVGKSAIFVLNRVPGVPLPPCKQALRWTYCFHSQWFTTFETEPPLKAKRVLLILPLKIGGQVLAKLQQPVAAIRRSDKSLRHVYWRIFVKIFISATEFCRCKMSAHQKIKSDRICATCRGDKILLQKERFFHKNSPGFVFAMCRRNVLLELVARLVHTEWSVAETCWPGSPYLRVWMTALSSPPPSYLKV